MRPFPHIGDFITSHGKIRLDAESFQRARADWYRDEVVPLLLDMRQHQGAIQPYIKRIDAALKACEEDKS